MASFNESTKYVVIDFARNADEQRNVDLVPRSWLKYGKESWKCAFPPSNEYDLLKSWVPQGFFPKSSWKYFCCKIVKEADDYEQGLRRLNRAIPSETVISTDVDIDEITTPVVLKGDSLQKALEINEDGGKRTKPSKRTKESLQSMQAIDEHDSPQTKKIKKIISLEVKKELAVVQTTMLESMCNLRRNLQFDLKKESESVKSTVVANTNHSAVQEDKETLGVIFPIDNLSDFQDFDKILAEKAKKHAFHHYMRVMHSDSNDRDACVRKILEALMTKSLQLQYSACGRQVNGIAKIDFSKTNIYTSISEFLKERYVDVDQKKELISVISRWFSGASDRDGGRKLRVKD